MKKIWNSFIVAFAMYSKIPMPRADWAKENMRYSMCFFPVIGLVIGLLELGFFHLATCIGFSDLFRAAIMVLIPVIITGGIHVDGLLDTSDALSSWQEKERRLEILKDSNAGAFAVIIGIGYFIAAFAGAYEVNEKTVKVLLFGFCISRCLSALSVNNFQNANKKGTAYLFGANAWKTRVNVALLISLAVLYLLVIMILPLYGIIMTAASLLVFLYYRYMSYKYFGGITGDLAGYFLCVAELTMLLSVVVGDRIAGVIV